jgi:hypothetical protein
MILGVGDDSTPPHDAMALSPARAIRLRKHHEAGYRLAQQ